MSQLDAPSPAATPAFLDGSAVRIFRALGDCTRFRIVRMLVERGEMGCSELHAAFPLSSPCMSHHTRILQECGLIGLRKDGAYHFFHAREETIRLYSPALLIRSSTGDCD
jgi:DNA-binding transcriptional ArsR family regulator